MARASIWSPSSPDIEALFPTVKGFGAVGDGVANDEAGFVAAALSGKKVIVPNGTWNLPVQEANVATILGFIPRMILETNDLTIKLPAGAINLSQRIPISEAKGLKILGAPTTSTSVTAFIGVTGVAKNYAVTISVSSSVGISANDYVIVRQNIVGTGDFYVHAGIWKVIAVNSGGPNRLTLLNTCHASAFPTNTLTGGTVLALKTLLKFSGCDGFVCESGTSIDWIDKVGIIGDYVLATNTGTHGTHGILMGSPNVAAGGDSNAVFDTAGAGAIKADVGISGFGEQGIAVSMRASLVCNFIASCSNRKRGIYAEGGHIRTKFAVSNGNGEDGFITDTTGMIQAALSISSGNGLNGYWSTNLSFINCSNSFATSNQSNGYEARGATRLAADVGKAMNNGLYGFVASDGGMIDADSAIAEANGSGGFEAGSGSVIDCDNSTSINNAGFGYRAQYGSIIRANGSTASGNSSGSFFARNGSILFESGGEVAILDIPTYSINMRIYNALKTLYFGVAVTSIGDITFTASGAAKLTIKANDGTLYPNTALASSNGRTTEPWLQTFSGTYFTGTAMNQLIRGGAGSPNGSVVAVPGSLWLNVTGGALVSLYVKESGTGNTGWVGK